MTKLFFPYTKALIALFAFSAILFSCTKKDLVIKTNIPGPMIYMSQAAVATVGPNANGVYSITPNIEGVAQRFSVDVPGKKFNIPLGILRSGVDADGAYTLTIASNTDTINKLIAAKKFLVTADPALTTELLPSTAFTLPASADLDNGSMQTSFTLGVDLNFLINSATATPKKRYAVAVGIANAKSSIINPAIAMTVILIDPVAVILPVANFTSYVFSDKKTAGFINTSANGSSYQWNFGDATAIVTTTSPTHVYAASGTYTVTLTTTGIAGSGSTVLKTTTVVIP